jgi:hypothetical protein
VWLGKRSTRGRLGTGGELISRIPGLLAAAGVLVIVERFRVIVSDLPREEIHRLRKCTGVAKPCIVAIDGVEQGNPMRIMATSIHWQD